ncbi:unnamed protein product [Nyctereutes procyonoides]|uniref:(raccoon dog) hypothetical protein n=1 Tax=Nyctereutes procyonoides TaxID=34880 RepID=A0A811YET3_NYCPR|nr:unnamed protein product [Nyctereutes procyonoides]
MRSLGWALTQDRWCFYKKRRSGYRHTKKEDHMRSQGEDGHLRDKKRSLRRNQPHLPIFLSWTPCLQNWEEINVCV